MKYNRCARVDNIFSRLLHSLVSVEHEKGNFISTSNFFCSLCKHHMHLMTKKNSTNNLGLRKVNALPLIRQPDRVMRKAREWATADCRHLTHGQIFCNFILAQLRLFSGLEMLIYFINFWVINLDRKGFCVTESE